jgi:sigma-B regulation protein RsbU (phosphoserine phosphatase)
MSQLNGFRISSFNINNSPYGGDYFDSVKTSESAVVLFMSDSSYSGIDSAIISLELYAVLHTPAKVLNSPDKILSTMNWVISTSRFTKKYASAYCVILSSSGELTYASASFNAMVIFNPRSDAFTACDTVGVPVGVDRTSKYELKSVRLVPGSTGIIYSDGLVSSINPNGEPYSFDRVKELLRDGKNKSPADLTRDIFNDLNGFTQSKKQINDVSVIIFKFK